MNNERVNEILKDAHRMGFHDGYYSKMHTQRESVFESAGNLGIEGLASEFYDKGKKSGIELKERETSLFPLP